MRSRRILATDFRTVWLTTFFAFLVLGTAWSVAQPVFSGTDEPAHFLHAEAIWSGQFSPPQVHGYSHSDSGVVHVRVPPNGDGCYIFQPDKSAGCDHTSLKGRATQGVGLSYVSREPPLPLLFNGLPAYLLPDRTGLYLSRGIDTVIGAASLATVMALAVTRRRPFLVVGVVLAATPAALASMGVMGSTELEFSAALVLWVSFALLAEGERPTPKFVALTTVAAVVLAVARPISFVWVVVAAVALFLAIGRRAARELVSTRAVKIALGLAGAATLFGFLWYVFATAPSNPDWFSLMHLPRVTGLSQRISIPLGAVQGYWLQVIGTMGFNEYTGPWWMTLGWTALLGLAVGAGMLFADMRRRVATWFLIAVMLLLPVAVQAVTLPTTGLVWGGRYDLPLLAGVAILGISTLDRKLPQVPDIGRLVSATFAAVPVLVMLSFAGTLRRYTVGVDGTLNPFHWQHGWHPPIPGVALLVLAAAVFAVTYWSIYRWLRPLLRGVQGRRASPTVPGRMAALPAESRSAGTHAF